MEGIGRELRISRIEYEILPGDQEPTAGELVDEVPMSVRLIFDSGAAARFRWTAGERYGSEGLVFDGESGLVAEAHGRLIDVSERWPMFIGDRVQRFDFAVYETMAGLEAWACRIHCGSGRSLLVALGALRDGRPIASVDDLIVTADRQVAENLRPSDAVPGTWDSAWGVSQTD